MTYDAIKKYLQEQMKMSHVYQPVMLRRLLIVSGTAKVEEIALDLVQNDLSQIEYYTDRVLRNHDKIDVIQLNSEIP